ncbi:MAG: LPXTG cell wall anchor domain-containing protein [Pseudobutyrivibrio sp.]|nr:LPXTG cell wall anchor domain-containing protein [Pseudobutyrivibrio sp.]
MKNFKKVIATLLAAVMMMAMSVTAFAAESTGGATIKINNAEEADVFYEQIIKADTTVKTGWSFVDPSYAKAFGNEDEQTIIEKLTKGDFDEYTRMGALENLPATNKATGTEFTVTEPGFYVVKLQTKAGAEELYSYNPMAYYVSLEDIANNAVLSDKTAKKEPAKVDKTIKTEDEYVEIGKDIEYTVKATVPYVPEGKQIAENGLRFAVHDSITGAEYKLTDGKFVVTATLAGDAITLKDGAVKLSDDKKSFTVDLSELVTATNSKANQVVELKYLATAKEIHVANKAYPEVNGHKYDDEKHIKTVDSYTVAIEIVKTGDKGAMLPDAEFVVVKHTGNKTEYALLDENKTLVGWTTDLDEAKNDANVLKTNEDGFAEAKGFDKDVVYTVLETKAPTGYQLLTSENKVTNTVQHTEGDKTSWAFQYNVADTTLSSLPFTGGMGTTLFTVLGVVLMVVAAALYFATKKKGSVN